MTQIIRPHRWVEVTTEVLYRMPDHPSILQTFVRQMNDAIPDFPEIRKFLEFWGKMLPEAPIVGVRFVHHGLVTPREIRTFGADKVFRTH